MHVNWLLLSEILYLLVVIIVCLRVVYDTRDSVKTLAYLLLVIFLPLAGMFIYFSVGINYRKRKLYSKKLYQDDALAHKVQEEIFTSSRLVYQQAEASLHRHRRLMYMLSRHSMSPLTGGNVVRLLINGEEKFPDMLEAIRQARHHIHLEYYIFEEGQTAREIAEALRQKAAEGVSVRFIYDDFGSRSIRRSLLRGLRDAGVQAFPFHRVWFIALANRLNYRNHRKILIVDGQTAFVGGINISDRYVNGLRKQTYWRDTHLRIDGPGVYYLQYLFLCDWNFCASEQLEPAEAYFPRYYELQGPGQSLVQIAASGPDSDQPDVLFSMLQAINQARRELLITTPYFIPGQSMLDALLVTALAGVRVRLLVPLRSDSVLVDLAARSYYAELLEAGVEVWCYTRGLVHAKTLVADRSLAIVGTANMDYRSFDLNFEVNALVYDPGVAGRLADIFEDDLLHAKSLDPARWMRRSVPRQLLEKTARLFSPLL